jgi:hypothetical protein
MSELNKTTIVLSRESAKKLRELGAMHDTYEDVISKLLTYAPKVKEDTRR